MIKMLQIWTRLCSFLFVLFILSENNFKYITAQPPGCSYGHKPGYIAGGRYVGAGAPQFLCSDICIQSYPTCMGYVFKNTTGECWTFTKAELGGQYFASDISKDTYSINCCRFVQKWGEWGWNGDIQQPMGGGTMDLATCKQQCIDHYPKCVAVTYTTAYRVCVLNTKTTNNLYNQLTGDLYVMECPKK